MINDVRIACLWWTARVLPKARYALCCGTKPGRWDNYDGGVAVRVAAKSVTGTGVAAPDYEVVTSQPSEWVVCSFLADYNGVWYRQWWVSSESTGTKLQNKRRKNPGCIPSSGKGFFSQDLSYCLWGPPNLMCNEYQGVILGIISRSVRLTIPINATSYNAWNYELPPFPYMYSWRRP